jgi:hypothetical protein
MLLSSIATVGALSVGIEVAMASVGVLLSAGVEAMLSIIGIRSGILSTGVGVMLSTIEIGSGALSAGVEVISSAIEIGSGVSSFEVRVKVVAFIIGDSGMIITGESKSEDSDELSELSLTASAFSFLGSGLAVGISSGCLSLFLDVLKNSIIPA